MEECLFAWGASAHAFAGRRCAGYRRAQGGCCGECGLGCAYHAVLDCIQPASVPHAGTPA